MNDHTFLSNYFNIDWKYLLLSIDSIISHWMTFGETSTLEVPSTRLNYRQIANSRLVIIYRSRDVRSTKEMHHK